MRVFVTVACLFLALPIVAHSTESPFSDDFSVNVVVTHADVDLKVDFASHKFEGVATLDLDWKSPDAKALVLNELGLDISAVEAIDTHGKFLPVRYKARDSREKLVVDVSSHPSRVRIHYTTLPKSRSIHWLDAVQTTHKQDPFVATSESSLAWLPWQTDEASKLTWALHVTVPEGMRAVMSGTNDPDHALGGTFTFQQTRPVAPEGIFLAVGNLAARKLDSQHVVYAAPAVLDAASKRLEDVPRMIKVLTDLYGSYPWDRCDILVMPEVEIADNHAYPALLTVSELLLEKGETQVRLLPEAVVESWLNQRITPAGPGDIWLGEAISQYLQDRIVGTLYGASRRNAHMALSNDSLRASIKQLPRNAQRLSPKPEELLQTQEPRSYSVAGFKGAWFFYALESSYGALHFDEFVKTSLKYFAGKPVTSEQWIAFLNEQLITRYPNGMSLADVRQWVFYPGIVSSAPNPGSARIDAINQQRTAFVAGTLPASDLAAEDWDAWEWMYFLQALPEHPKLEQVNELEHAWHLSKDVGPVVARTWLPIAISAGDKRILPAVASFLSSYPKQFWSIPVFLALTETPSGKAFARETFGKVKQRYPEAFREMVQERLLTDEPPKPHPSSD